MDIKCSFNSCGSVNNNFEEWLDHMKKDHIHEEVFRCCFCLKSFPKLWRMGRHSRSCDLKPDKNARKCSSDETTSTSHAQPVIDSFPHEDSDFVESILNSNESVLPLSSVGEKRKSRHITTIKSVEDGIFDFLLRLYGKIALPKNIAHDTLREVNVKILSPLITSIQDNDCEKDFLEKITFSLSKFIRSLGTDYKFRNMMKDKNLFFDPVCFKIAHPRILTNGHLHSHGYVMPIVNNIKSFFDANINELSSMLELYNDLIARNDGVIESEVQSNVWKEKMLNFEGLKVVPIRIYQDDFEINNSLGSKSGKQKISGIYLSFPLLDKKNRSKLGSTLAACFTFSKDMKYGLSSNFSKLVEQLIELEEVGIPYVIKNCTTQVYFVVSYIHGDNLGLNCMLGYRRSFRCDGCCRNCIATYEQIKDFVEEDASLLRRSPTNIIDTTGVEQKCPFEAINSFFVTDNCSVDVFHDFNEGYLHTEIIFSIKKFMKEGYFDLETLNIRKNTFEYYTAAEKKNMCLDITKEHLKKKKLKMSGSEIATFFKYYPVFIGEFVPSDDRVWKLISLLHKMMNLCYKDSFTDEDINELKILIIHHHTLYKEITSKSLTFKHHVVTHYPSVIKELSPPKKMSTIRMEGFHRVSKAYANCTSSRKNILLSLSEKHQYYHIYQVTKNKTYKVDQVHLEIKKINKLDGIRNQSFVRDVEENNLSYYKQLTHFDLTYNVNNAIKHNDHFLRIDNIVTLMDNIYLICSKLIVNFIDPHLNCAIVKVLHNCDHIVLDVKNLDSLPYSCFEYRVRNYLHEKHFTVLMNTNF